MDTNEINENLVNHLYGATANYVESLMANMSDEEKAGIRYAIANGGRILITVALIDGGAQLQAALEPGDGQYYRLVPDVLLGDTLRRLDN